MVMLVMFMMFVVKICFLESDDDDNDCGDEVACC